MGRAASELSGVPAAPPGLLTRAARGVGRCLPLIAGCALFAHLAWFGLRPALEEQRRLERASVDVHARRSGLEAELHTLERRRAALDDPFYRERLRRAERARQERTGAAVAAALARHAAAAEGLTAAGTAAADPTGGPTSAPPTERRSRVR